MEILLTTTIVLIAAILMIVINIFIYKVIVNHAIKRHINIYLDDNGYHLISVKFAGLFNTGDFKQKGFPFKPFMHSGYSMLSTYVYVYGNKKDLNEPIRLTAKINTIFLHVKNVEYSEITVLR